MFSPFQLCLEGKQESVNTNSGMCYHERKNLKPFLPFKWFIAVSTDTQLSLQTVCEGSAQCTDEETGSGGSLLMASHQTSGRAGT